jgi:hypothetical protein
MESDANRPPSGFYLLLEGAIEVVLKFPVDGDFVGPRWDDSSGEIDRSACPEWEEERVAVVPLGGNRYRLAERLMGPVSGLTLHWGDEFRAQDDVDGVLRLVAVCVPRPFVHYRFLTRAGFNNQEPIAQRLHAIGGGWESVAGGMLTLTVPSAFAGKFQRWMSDYGLTPGVL